MPYWASQEIRSSRGAMASRPPVNRGVVGYLGVDVARRLEGEHLRVGAELGLSGDQAVQRRVEDVDAERRDAVAGLGEAPSWQRGGQLVVLGLGQVDVGDQPLDRAGLRGRDLLGELVLVAAGLADAPQAQGGAGQVVIDDLAGCGRPLAVGQAGEQEPSFPLDAGVLPGASLGTGDDKAV
jgi:hypothetical protein